MGAQVQPIRSERKVVTALFADLAGSTALAERLDPEDVSEIVGGAIARVVAAVEDFGGTIKDLAGDGALALFGAPIAHEDDPERAVRAGIRIVEDVGAYADEVAREFGVSELNVRIGIETGLVVLGPVGGGSRVEYGATGDAVNTAARLQAAAAPGSVLVGAATHRLVEPVFWWGEAHTLMLKGKEQRVTAYEATALRAAGARVRGLPGTEPPLVGREPEFTALRQAADAVVAGTGTVVFITGEPGLGKSRLLAELRDFLADGAAWLEGRCVSYGEGLPYWPFRDLLRDWLGLSPATSEGDAREALRGRLAELSLGDRHSPAMASPRGAKHAARRCGRRGRCCCYAGRADSAARAPADVGRVPRLAVPPRAP